MIYGTAWKEDRTNALALQAYEAGFRAFDTANQKKHYREDFLGDALKKLFDQGVARESLWLQSKFTYERGQDHRLPYDPKASFGEQVRASFESTLQNLHTDYLDSFLIHGPFSGQAITAPDLEVYAVMQELKAKSRIKKIGISNVGIHHVRELVKSHSIDAIQNRCYAVRGWDRDVREFCIQNKIEYQGFSLLTANPHVVESGLVASFAKKHACTPAQIIFAFCRRIEIRCLTGTTNSNHMKQDLVDIELSSAEVDSILQHDPAFGHRG